MKMLRIAALALTVSLLAAGSAGSQQLGWFTNGAQTNPIGGQVMADTGPLDVFGDPPAAYYQIRVVVSGTVMATFDFEHRDAANASTLRSQQIRMLASGTQEIGPLTVQLSVQGERFRVVMVNGIVGTVQASIFKEN